MKFQFIKEIFSYIGMFIPYLKKIIYPEKRFIHDIRLHIDNVYPVEFVMNTNIPICRICLNIINLSQFLDAEIIDVNIQYLSINHERGRSAIINNKGKTIREVIHKKSIGNIFLEFDLHEQRIEEINRIKQFYNLEADLQVEIYIESKLYKSKLYKGFTSIPCKLSLAKYPVKED